jgi:hypothetical protein
MTDKHNRFFLLGYQYSNNISQLNKCSSITYMLPLETTATTTTFPLREEKDQQQQQQQQQKTRQGDMTVVGMKALDHHIERLEAKLSFLIRLYNDSRTDSLLYQYEKKIAIVKQEINEVMERRRCQIY